MTKDEQDGLSVEDLRAGLAALTTADHVRLHRAAGHFARGSGQSAEDILGDAVCAALDGRRICPRALAVAVFLVGVMKSQAWWARQKAKDDPVVESMSATGTDGPAMQLSDPNRNPEQALLAFEDYQARIRTLDEVFHDDEDAQLVLIGDFDGQAAADIREQTGFSETHYASVRRRIRRKIEKAAGSDGWPT